MAFLLSKILTSTGGTYSLGPFNIHLSPAVLLIPSSTWQSVAYNNNASSSARILISYTFPFSKISPGIKKKVDSPLTNSLDPHLLDLV